MFSLASMSFAQEEYYGPGAWRVGNITFTGNKSIDDGELKDLMELGKGKSFLEWQLQDDLDRIRSHYISNGFIDANVSEERRVKLDEKKVDIEILIYEGQKTHVSEITVRGVHILSEKDVRHQLKMKAGDPFNSNRIDDFEAYLKDAYARRGYPYMVLTPVFRFNHERDSVEVVLEVTEGKLTRFGEFTVAGNERVDESVILRALTIENGKVFNPQKLQESQENVYQIGLFRSVFFNVQGIDEEKDTLDILIEVKENDFRSFGFGLGYGSLQGIRTSGEWGQANLFKRAEKMIARVEFTTQPFEKSSPYNRTNSYAFSLSEPFFFFSRAKSLWTVSYQDFDFDSFDKVGKSGGLLLSRFYTRKKRVSLHFLIEESEISDVDSTENEVPEDILRNIGRHLRNSLELSYIRDRSDDIFNPTTGEVLKLSTTLAGGPLIGERDYYRIMGEYSVYRGVTVLGSRITLASHVKVGLVREFGTSDPVPPEEQFSIGGANSLRGYEELGIGLLSERERRDGNYLIQFNIESRFPIWRALDGVLFFDTGNIYDKDNRDFIRRKPFLLSSAGLGLRYRTPIGPVRVEQAVRLDENFGTKKMLSRLHISVGNPF